MLQHAFGDILGTQQKADVQFRIRQLLAAVAGHKAVFQVIVLDGRVLLHAAETAMMVGQHQPVFGHHYARAEASETHHGIFQRRFTGVIQPAGRHFQSQLFHGFPGLPVQVTQHPHAFVRMAC